MEDRATKPALYAQFGIPIFWRVATDPLRVTTYRLGADEGYTAGPTVERVQVAEPFPLDVALTEWLPAWAR